MMKANSWKLSWLPLLIAISGVLFYSCKGKVKDSDIEMAISEKAKTITGLGTANASVKDGVVTLSGEATDETAKVAYESAIKTIPGVKQVINNITVAPPAATEPVVINPDDTLRNAVNEVLRSYSTVKADVKDGVVTLTGDIKRAELATLMPLLHATKPKKIENKLTVKK